MTDLPLPGRYFELIDEIVQMTLKGKISSKEQVHQMLRQGVGPGTGEIFERCLGDRLHITQEQVNSQTDELKQAKAGRSLRALQTIQSEWQRAQVRNRASEAITAAVRTITSAEPLERLLALLKVLDPNRNHAFDSQQLRQLANVLQGTEDQELQQLSAGIITGLGSWQRLEPHLVSWIYSQSQELGFSGIPGQRGPWGIWAKQMEQPLPKALFQTLSLNQSLSDAITRHVGVDLQSWVELAVVLQYLQRGLVSWFDKMVYDAKVGSKLSISTFLAFAIIWSQLAQGFGQNTSLNSSSRERFARGCWQISQQLLRTFAQREYFPLYGGVFASFTGDYLRDTLHYLDEPLQQIEGTQEKARILTLLGYSLQAQGQLRQAVSCHQQALAVARESQDIRCEIANLNHLSRTYVAQKNYAEAIGYSQRALILSRQSGESLGEANALANLGYSEVFSAREAGEPVGEMAIQYLQQGLKLAEQLGDGQSQALCHSSLGIAYIVLGQPQAAIAHLESGWQAAQFSGDLYLQGLNLAYLAEAHYTLQNLQAAVCSGCLGMYLLEQIAASEWRQPAGLLTILQGQLGPDFPTVLQRARAQIIPLIGVDGYDHLPQLLQQYQQSM